MFWQIQSILQLRYVLHGLCLFFKDSDICHLVYTEMNDIVIFIIVSDDIESSVICDNLAWIDNIRLFSGRVELEIRPYLVIYKADLALF